MSILHGERAVLREAYKALDEALEFANAELNKGSDGYGHRIAREYLESGTIQSIEDNLKAPPDEMYRQSPQLTTELAILLSNCYDLVTIIKEVYSQTERVVELARQHQIDYSAALTGEGDMRTPTDDRDRPKQGSRHRTRPGKVEGSDPPSNITVGNFGAGNLRQETDPSEPD